MCKKLTLLAFTLSSLLFLPLLDVRAEEISATDGYVSAMSLVFHDDGKLMARVLLESTGEPNASPSSLQAAAKYIFDKMSAMTPPPEFQTAHEEMRTTFNMIANPDPANPILLQIMLTSNNLNPRGAFALYAGNAFSDLDKAVQSAKGKSADWSDDPWLAAAKDPNGKPNTTDNSAKFGITSALQMNSAALEQIDPSFARFLNAVGTKKM